LKKFLKKNIKWHDKYRECQDGYSHYGDLELVDWKGIFQGSQLGWGAFVEEESEEYRQRFLSAEFGDGNEERFYEYSPVSFRWTCCGCVGDNNDGCDHHGTGPNPCKCDYCVGGRQITNATVESTAYYCKNLNLSLGPDPRSYSSSQSKLNESMRGLAGLD
jgi:hypothetical protein